MIGPRVIPRLDIKGPNLVKGIHLEGLRVLGKPYRFAQYYYEHGADELVYMDAVASLYNRNSLDEIIRQTSRQIFIPLTVGGGLRTLDDISRVLKAGADKVAINTAALADPEFIRRAARRFGSSTIVLSIEAMPNATGRYEAYTNNGRQRTGQEVLAWAQQGVELGAGEVMVTAIHQEGTGRGFDVGLTHRIAAAVPVPVIAAGGAGRPDHVAAAITEGLASAVSLAALLHYNVLRQLPVLEEDYSTEGNLTFLKQPSSVSGFQDTTLEGIKEYCRSRGIPCRQAGPSLP